MYTDEIERVLNRESLTKKIFGGVFSSDQLGNVGKIKQTPKAFVVNLCSMKEKNDCHWITIFIDNDHLEYFDSGGADNHRKNVFIKNFIQAQGKKKILFNRRQIQSYASEKCGEFCCLYIFCKAAKYPMKSIMKLFSEKNLSLNDDIVAKLFKCVFKNFTGLKCIKKKRINK